MPDEKKDIDEVPKETAGRLPLYLRRLLTCRESGKEWVTSDELVEDLPGIRSSNLRKDLSFFGDYGIQGRGYNVNRLIDELSELLRVDRKVEVALAGIGRLGTALLNYGGFENWGFEINLAFDVDSDLIGSRVGGVRVDNARIMEKKVKARDVKVGIITVPVEEAQSTANSMISAGITNIANFSAVLLDTPSQVTVTQVDITSTLEVLTFYQ